MKIRIEISSGNMSYVMDKEVDMDITPQAIVEDIEHFLSTHEVDPNYKGCSVCENYEPCVNCVSDGLHYTHFTRKTY